MIALTALALSATLPLQEPDTTRLDPIVVTATRVPVPASDLTNSVTVIRGDDLRARGVFTVASALREVPSATVVQSGSFGGVTSLFLRGGESDYVQVLIDGVTVNQPGGAYDFAHLSTENIDRIEVLRGPGSVLYGSEATTGVVQVFTRRGSGATRYDASVRGGTFGSVGFDANMFGGAGDVQYAFGASHFLTDGTYPFNSDYASSVWSGRVEFEPDEGGSVSLAVRYRDSRFHFPTDGAGNVVDRNALTLDEATSVAIEAARQLTDDVELRLLVTSNVASLGTDDLQDDVADTTGLYLFRSLQNLRRQSADLRANVSFDRGIVVSGGIEVERQDERSFSESRGEFGPSNGSTDEGRDNRSAYAQVLFHRGGVLAVAGARLDHNSGFGTFWTHRVGAGYRFGFGLKVHASLGRSFKAPTFFENFAAGFVEGNPDLAPERSTSWEVSMTQQLLDGRVDLTGTYFTQAFRDLIQFTFAQSPNYANVAKADASGLEIAMNARLWQGLTMTASYSYSDTEVLDAGFDTDGASFVVGNRLLRRPTNSAKVSVDAAGWDRGHLGMGVAYIGNRDDRDFSSFPPRPIVLPATTTVDLWGSFDVWEQQGSRPALRATLRVENLFDASYDTTAGFPARGRTIFVGGRIDGGGGR